jgi:hypothetical protein
MKEDFYVGYQPKMPRAFVRTVKPFVIGLLALAAGLAALFWLVQNPFPRSGFEFGTVRDFEGTIQFGPIPFLLVEKSSNGTRLPQFARFPLVGEGKHGVGEKLEAFDGQKVKLKGTLIYRDDLQMIEVLSDTVEQLPTVPSEPEERPHALGAYTLKGEIVDSKCYLGVMNPGQSKPHRDCAVACLRGGIPPLFIVRDAAGEVSELWLISETGTAVNAQILDFVAEPVEISGDVSRSGDQLFFRINPAQIKRLP